ncbi:MAG: glycosyltransferase family 4 protein [Sedimentisphaerales bacterium]|nr:glycosyltransferase family 4 protein [Sedimentisphaerales bacterium]
MKVALITRIMAHYREPIFSLLARQKGDGAFEFTFFAGKRNEYTTVETIDPARAFKPAVEGGFDWRYIRTISIFGCGVWQTKVLPIFAGGQYDVIILDTTIYYLSTWIGLLLARMRKKKVIIWGHGFKKNESGIKARLRMCQYNLADAMLLYGNRGKDILVQKGYDPAKIYLVYNSLDYDRQVSLRDTIDKDMVNRKREQLFTDSNLPVLVYIGRLNAEKKLEFLLEAVARLKTSDLICNVLFVGEGQYKSRLIELARELQISNNVVFYGACYDESEIAYIMTMTEVTVVPDAIGLSCIHSLVYGVPVVTSDNFDVHGPEFEAIIPGQTGGFYQNGKVESLVQEISKWLRRSDKETVRQNCMKVIDLHYNPHYQQKVINQALNEVTQA